MLVWLAFAALAGVGCQQTLTGQTWARATERLRLVGICEPDTLELATARRAQLELRAPGVVALVAVYKRHEQSGHALVPITKRDLESGPFAPARATWRGPANSTRESPSEVQIVAARRMAATMEALMLFIPERLAVSPSPRGAWGRVTQHIPSGREIVSVSLPNSPVTPVSSAVDERPYEILMPWYLEPPAAVKLKGVAGAAALSVVTVPIDVVIVVPVTAVLTAAWIFFG